MLPYGFLFIVFVNQHKKQLQIRLCNMQVLVVTTLLGPSDMTSSCTTPLNPRGKSPLRSTFNNQLKASLAKLQPTSSSSRRQQPSPALTQQKERQLALKSIFDEDHRRLKLKQKVRQMKLSSQQPIMSEAEMQATREETARIFALLAKTKLTPEDLAGGSAVDGSAAAMSSNEASTGADTASNSKPDKSQQEAVKASERRTVSAVKVQRRKVKLTKEPARESTVKSNTPTVAAVKTNMPAAPIKNVTAADAESVFDWKKAMDDLKIRVNGRNASNCSAF